MLLCKAKRQYLLTCKVSRYCFLALPGCMGPINNPSWFWTSISVLVCTYLIMDCQHPHLASGSVDPVRRTLETDVIDWHAGLVTIHYNDVRITCWLCIVSRCVLPCKSKRQYLLTLQLNRYCLLTLLTAMSIGVRVFQVIYCTLWSLSVAYMLDEWLSVIIYIDKVKSDTITLGH